MKFAVFLMADSNYHIAGWRHPDAVADAGSNFARWVEFARILERGKLDMLFVADVIGVPGTGDPRAL
ncbi:MAG: nitrilotriacetate monooxygenase, partial [Micropepsaceae bacterium]